jgi:hypothetical protein
MAVTGLLLLVLTSCSRGICSFDGARYCSGARDQAGFQQRKPWLGVTVQVGSGHKQHGSQVLIALGKDTEG